MKKLIAAVAAAALTSSIALVAAGAPAQAITFQSGYCDITLASSYTTNSVAQITTPVPNSSVSCPGFTFTPGTDSLNTWFTTADGRGYANFATKNKLVYDAATDTSTTEYFLELIASAMSDPYTQVSRDVSGAYNETNYVVHNNLNYKVRLTAPFMVVEGFTGDSCTLTIPDLTYIWGQDNYFTIPDSAMKCTNFTWNSKTYQFSGDFKGSNGNWIRVNSNERRVYDPTTKTTSIVYQLEASMPFDPNSGGFFGLRCRCNSAGSISGVDGFGKYKALTTPYVTRSTVPSTRDIDYPVTLAKPFKLKAATEIVATPSRMVMDDGTKMISLHIQADRNQSFQSGDVPSYKRQPVIPKRTADQPTVLRGKKLIATVKLDKFGEATIMLPDTKGTQKYTVQMPKTASNYLGKTHFTM